MKDKLYKIMNWPEIEAIVYGEEKYPSKILGRHFASAYTLIQTFMPDAQSVSVLFDGDKKKHTMEMADEAGFFAVSVLGKELRDYVFEVQYKNGEKATIHDPYVFDAKMLDSEALSWNKGTSLHAYKYLGAHIDSIGSICGVRFRVWAPNAVRVSIVGDFNNWNGMCNPMDLDDNTGVFSIFIPDLKTPCNYRFEICTKGGECYQKFDPYSCFYNSELDCSSLIVEEYKWNDDAYLASRSTTPSDSSILNIFEIDNDLWSLNAFSKKQIDELCKYVSEVGYTHVLLNISAAGLYCIDDKISSNDLKLLIDSLHKAGIGAMIKWNPCFFDPGTNGIKVYDGTYLYGHLDERKRYNAMFGYNYNYGREQVDDYLISNLIYWLEEYHIDGIHIDDLSTILYLDYGKKDNESLTNIYGGNENLEAIAFIKKMNAVIHSKFNGCISTTKETCMFPKVTYGIKEDGLGFDYIWDNGFGEDYLEYLTSDIKDIRKLTDSMAYAYSENYILTISKEDVFAANDYDCDRVANGCGYFDSISYDDSFKMAVKRATLAFFMAHPGKKLLFLGQDEKTLSIKLNELYKSLPAFYELDRYKEGFEWVNAFAGNSGVISFLRKNDIFKNNILVICNFSTENYGEYKLGVPYEGKYKCFLCSEDTSFGGDHKASNRAVNTVDEEYDGKECTITVSLPAMSVSYYSYEPYSEEEFIKIANKKALKIKKELEAEAERRAKELEAEAKRKAKEYNSLIKKNK